ncbi:MAG TPA: hypothetical protein VEY09_13275 [Pyrinomonadaceae bacterium]|nr:hypothetical protein [Pyrinomonadaceae bacterium]
MGLFDNNNTLIAELDERAALEERCRSGARWFYWIAALSLLTSLVSLSGNQWGFILSLGVTQVIDALAAGLAEGVGNAAKVVALALDLSIVGAFALAGYLSERRHTWAFVTGMVFYALDSLLFVYVADWLGIAFHAFALYCMFTGLRACLKLGAATREATSVVPPPPLAEQGADAPAHATP